MNAHYALPGIMPPDFNKFRMRLRTNADGSIRLLIHSGVDGDVVRWSFQLKAKGTRPLPLCKRILHCVMPFRAKKDHDLITSLDHPEMCTITSETDDSVVIPSEYICDVHAYDTFWVLDIPAGLLKMGTSVVEVIVNGELHKHILNNPASEYIRKTTHP